MAAKKYVWFDSGNRRWIGNFTEADLKRLRADRILHFPWERWMRKGGR